MTKIGRSYITRSHESYRSEGFQSHVHFPYLLAQGAEASSNSQKSRVPPSGTWVNSDIGRHPYRLIRIQLPLLGLGVAVRLVLANRLNETGIRHLWARVFNSW